MDRNYKRKMLTGKLDIDIEIIRALNKWKECFYSSEICIINMYYYRDRELWKHKYVEGKKNKKKYAHNPWIIKQKYQIAMRVLLDKLDQALYNEYKQNEYDDQEKRNM